MKLTASTIDVQGAGPVPVRETGGDYNNHNIYRLSQSDITNTPIAMTVFELNAAVSGTTGYIWE